MDLSFPLGAPTEGKNLAAVFVRVGKYQPYVEQGEQDTPEHRTATVPEDLPPDELTLAKAIELLDQSEVGDEPIGICPDTHKPVFVKSGRFGPYVQLGKLFASIPKEEDPMTIDYDRAVELIKEKREADAKKIIKTFPENEDVQLLNGRWGPYLKIGRKNFKLPKDVEPEKLTLEQCIEISENQPAPRKGRAKKKK